MKEQYEHALIEIVKQTEELRDYISNVKYYKEQDVWEDDFCERTTNKAFEDYFKGMKV